MRVIRILVAVVCSLLVLFFLATLLSIFTPFSDGLCVAIALPFALIVGWTVWKALRDKKISVGLATLSGALIVGGLGLSVGFLGPALFNPGANQGPMLGIFITGPLGALLGAISGFLFGVRTARDEGSDQPT